MADALRTVESLIRLLDADPTHGMSADGALDVLELLVRSGWRPPSGWVVELLRQFAADFGLGSGEPAGPDALLGIVGSSAPSHAEDVAVRRARRLFALQESEAAQGRAQLALAESLRLSRVSQEIRTHSKATRRRAVRSDPAPTASSTAQRTQPARDASVQLEGLQATIGQLEEAVESNRTIGAAVGVAMERFQLDRTTALTYLVRQSQASNVKLVVVAEQLLTTAERGYTAPNPVRRSAPRR